MREKNRNKARYYPPEVMPFVLCVACLNVVLEHSEKARQLYDEVVECHDLRGCRETLDKIEEKVPKREKLLKRIVKESGFDYKKSPERKNIGIPYMRGLLKGGIELAKKYQRGIRSWVLRRRERKRDFSTLIRKIDELIKAGFNSESDQAKGKYRVTIKGSESLMLVICFSTLRDYCRLRLDAWEKLRVITIGGRTYSLKDVINDETTTRMHRFLSRHYREAGFVLKHDKKLENVAERWYQCRVINSGPEEYCRKLLLHTGEDLDPANLSNEIKECDEALGYLRSRKKAGK